MPTIDEELQAYYEELERQRQIERQRRAEAKGLVKQELKRRAMKIAGKAAKKAAAAGAQAAVSTLASAISAIAAAIAPYLGVALLVIGLIFFVIIVLTAMCNAGGFSGRLAQISSGALGLVSRKFDFCDSLQGFKGVVEVIDKGQLPFCHNLAAMASQNNVPYPKRNDPQLDLLISCIRRQVPIPNSEVFTFDLSHISCNYTRGQPLCDRCSHAASSCHYGGSSGTTGALAVDFAVRGGTGVAVLQVAGVCSRELGTTFKRATCENTSGDAVFCNNPGATHVHISISPCDKDNGPINTQ